MTIRIINIQTGLETSREYTAEELAEIANRPPPPPREPSELEVLKQALLDKNILVAKDLTDAIANLKAK